MKTLRKKGEKNNPNYFLLSFEYYYCLCISDGRRGITSAHDVRISKTGAVFKGVTLPALGNAYRDPSGLIWGSPPKLNGKILHFTYRQAENYCSAAGLRLPTKEEYTQLAVYLGYGSVNGFSNFADDGKTEIIATLS